MKKIGIIIPVLFLAIIAFNVAPVTAVTHTLGVVGSIDMPDDNDAQYMGRFTALTIDSHSVEGRLKTLVTYDADQGGRILIVQGHVDDIEVIHLRCMVDLDRVKVTASWDKSSETGDSNAKGTFYWRYTMTGRIGQEKDLTVTLLHYAWGDPAVRPRPGYIEIVWTTP